MPVSRFFLDASRVGDDSFGLGNQVLESEVVHGRRPFQPGMLEHIGKPKRRQVLLRSWVDGEDHGRGGTEVLEEVDDELASLPVVHGGGPVHGQQVEILSRTQAEVGEDGASIDLG